jgi:hypothetical protein
MEQQEQARFEGWAIVDMLGHLRYAGYVRSDLYGTTALFRVDVPELPEREEILEYSQYLRDTEGNYDLRPGGSRVKYKGAPASTKLVGAGAIYCISPCSKEEVLKAIEMDSHEQPTLVSLPSSSRQIEVEDSVDLPEDASEESKLPW